jgi:deoxyribodipyrimidine photo-lyase
MQHLLDGDPASNTLSWRWVAGLHTRGKAYAARAENIRRYTDGRYDPAGLNEDPVPLTEPEPPAPQPLAKPAKLPGGDVALLLHLDDLHPESLDLGQARVARVAALLAPAEGAAAAVRAFDHAALSDALARAAAHFGAEAVPMTPELPPGWSAKLPVVAPWAPVGPSADHLPIDAIRIRRPWDNAVWPRSHKGFFQVKAAIPRILALGCA